MTDREAQGAKLFRILQTQAGVSRRRAIDLVLAGEVELDGVALDDPFATPDLDAARHLSLRGHPLSLQPPAPRIYRFHKPAGMLCSHDDPHAANTVGRVLRAEGFLGYTWVGRLDQDAEGLLLLSNDGRFIQAMTHPRYEVPKEYRVALAEPWSERDLDRALRAMQAGIEDEGEFLRALAARREPHSRHAVLTLAEGKKHEVKRLFARFGFTVTRLVRVAIGPVELGDLRLGQIQRLPVDLERDLLERARAVTDDRAAA